MDIIQIDGTLGGFHNAFAILQRHGVASLTAVEQKLRRLPIAELCVIPEVFQPRQDVGVTAAHGKHLAELVRVLRAGKELTAIRVLKINTLGWVVVDGHHRFQAYGLAGGKRTHAPVSVLDGTLEEALRVSVAENAPDTLNMSLTDKREAAFRMVVLGIYSQAVISNAAGVSESTVDRMRSSLASVRKAHPLVPWETRSWADVKWTVRGECGGGGMWKDRLAQRVARDLTKHFKGTAKDTPALFAAGLILHDLDAAEAIARATLDLITRQRAAVTNDDF